LADEATAALTEGKTRLARYEMALKDLCQSQIAALR